MRCILKSSLHLLRLPWWTYQCVGIQEHAFAVLSQGPAVNLGKGDAKLRTSKRGQVQTVPALNPVHHDDLIKDAVEGAPGGVKDHTG